MRVLLTLSLLAMAFAYPSDKSYYGRELQPVEDDLNYHVCQWFHLLETDAGKLFINHLSNLKNETNVGSLTMRDVWEQYFLDAHHHGILMQATEFRKHFEKELQTSLSLLKDFIIEGVDRIYHRLNYILSKDGLTLDQIQSELEEVFMPIREIIQHLNQPEIGAEIGDTESTPIENQNTSAFEIDSDKLTHMCKDYPNHYNY